MDVKKVQLTELMLQPPSMKKKKQTKYQSQFEAYVSSQMNQVKKARQSLADSKSTQFTPRSFSY